MEKIADNGDEELYNKLDVAYASSDEETEETDVRILVFIIIRLCILRSHMAWCYSGL